MNNQIKEEGLTNAYLLGKYDGIKQGRAEVIDELLSKLHTAWLYRGNDVKAYREELDYIAERLKENK